MGRPKLYNSAAERVLAHRTYSKIYYRKNRDRLSIKNKARYQCKRRPPHPDVAGLHKQLQSIIGPSLTDFLDRVIHNLANARSPDTSIQQLKDDIQRVMVLRTQGEDLQHEISQADGVCGRFYRVQKAVTDLKDVIFALQDVAFQGEIDVEDTVQQHRNGELYYQSHPDL
ncbi:hypothetical protein EV363DRAFT_1162370 [Boletus edulis]|uniref:Uncharacterized protein n=1 Tax=Boletus edulis BED1 TaxID=1328754 RepID=A0AAD4G6U8_BOLED|nr:hypothetical protein EV363DRAFT_1407632 [Boletus edulis]KAF8133175.1 hypothetical protein EV363DRAFT_1162370 [Boletus edulis]KAF8420273.1 hypothetical protein L210DRAFT_989880 [Boletus edulis BED1]